MLSPDSWEGWVALAGAVMSPFIWFGRKLFVLGQTQEATERRLGSLEKRDEEHDVQLLEIRRTIDNGLQRIQVQHEKSAAESRSQLQEFMLKFVQRS